MNVLRCAVCRFTPLGAAFLKVYTKFESNKFCSSIASIVAVAYSTSSGYFINRVFIPTKSGATSNKLNEFWSKK